MIRLTDFSLKRAAATLLLALTLVGLGGYAITQLNVELFPDMEFPIITVITLLPGGSASDIAEQVTGPVETVTGGLPGVRRVQTTSAENVSIAVAEFEFGTDLDATEADLRSSLEAVQFPQGTQPPRIARIDLAQFPVVQLSLSGDVGLEELQRLASEVVQPRLASIDGVFSVDVVGGTHNQLAVIVNPERARELGISLDQIVGLLGANQLALPVGTIASAQGVLPLRVSHTFTSVDQIRSLVVGVASGALPMPIRLGDVAEVVETPSPLTGISRTNGLPSVAIAINKAAEANTVRVANEVTDALDELRGQLEPGLNLNVVLDQSIVVEESIQGLVREGVLGSAFAVVVVFLFLLSLRSTLITAVSIPISLLVAILVLWWQGFTLNIMTMGGLTVAVGRVIDDSIVVLENVFRHVRRGEPLLPSIREGTREVVGAVTGSTLTTVAVFVPLMFLGGLVGEAFRPFAITVSVALLASLLVAMTVIPALARYLMGQRRPQAAGTESSGDAPDTWLQRVYTPLVQWSLRHRALVLVVAAALLVGSLAIVPHLQTTFMSTAGDKFLTVSVLPPPGSDLATVLDEAGRVEAVLAANPAVTLYQTTSGSAGGQLIESFRAISGRSAGAVTIYARLDQDADPAVVAAELREQFGAVGGSSLVSVTTPQSRSR